MANNDKKIEETSLASERETRIGRLGRLHENGINPYPASAKRTHTANEVLSIFSDLEKNKTEVTICGRLMTKRGHGNLTFANLKDASGKMQIALSKKDIGPDKYKLFDKLVDMGDFIEATGTVFLTHKEEKSLMLSDWKILSKALLPLPEKWHGIKDDDERYRKRYLDLLTNPELTDLFYKKSKFWESTREFLKAKGFLEVETPTLETTTGGAEAAPFKTHHNDFDIDVYLRISIGELWQKRLMAAGFEKTFEIGRAFRNEGSSPEHLQEFTNMEFYWAYADFNDGMKIAQEMYQYIAEKTFGTTKFSTKGFDFDLAGNWPHINYRDEILKQTNIDILSATEDEMKEKLAELKVKYDGDNKERLMDTLWKYCRKNIAGPAFLVNHPKLVSPLAKESKELPDTVERFQIIIAGSEIGNGYSELNDPIEQRRRFEIQQKLLEAGDEEAMMPDWEFVEMLEHGMPPTCGFGFGERLFSFLADKPLRECQLFPLMKPKIDQKKKDKEK